MNILLITIDCLRADHLSCMGYHRQTSPFIDSLAEKGMLFTQAIINGVGTFSSFPALMTSTYPFMHGGYERVNRKTIAEVLQKRGYVTAGFNDNAFLSPYFGYDRGFSHFDCMGIRRGETFVKKLARKAYEIASVSKPVSEFALKMHHYLFLWKSPKMGGASINNRVFSWLDENYTDNFFLWIHYMDVHGAHYAPQEYFRKIGLQPPSQKELITLNRKLGRSASKLYKEGKISEREIELLRATYDAEVRYVDDCIKEILNKLVSLGIDKNTAIIITADHGEGFFEHGDYHSAENFYDEMLRVPLVIYSSDIAPKRIDKQVESIDIAPTMLHLLNESEEPGFVGRSLLTHNTGVKCVISEAAHDYVTSSGTQKIVKIDFNLRKTSIRFERGNSKWKYINSRKENKEELYDLTSDPFEKNNLIGRKDREVEDILGEFRERLQAHFRLEEEQRRVREKIGRSKTGHYF
jgi:arylsulfatase A-like enzyme